MKKLTILLCLLLSGCRTIDFFVEKRIWKDAISVIGISKTDMPEIRFMKRAEGDVAYGRYFPKDGHIEIYLDENLDEELVYPIVVHEILQRAMDLKAIPLEEHHCRMGQYLESAGKFLHNKKAIETIKYWNDTQCKQEKKEINAEYIQCEFYLPRCEMAK